MQTRRINAETAPVPTTGYVQALESLRRHDLGGLEVGYGPGRRTGSTYVELSILTEDGRYRR